MKEIEIKIKYPDGSEMLPEKFNDWNEAINFLNDLWTKEMDKEDVKI